MHEKLRARNVNILKAANISILANGLQVVLVLAIAVYTLLYSKPSGSTLTIRAIVVLASVIVAIGAVMDIREAANTRRMLEQLDAMDRTIQDMETLNNTLRTQRHDFLNHLQVVFSLIEMKEYDEANAYIEKIYGDITAVSRALKTANPSINALLQVKLAACEKEHVKVRLDIRSSWKDLPVPGWEMCKVLSNLIDNALDALRETDQPELTITLTEDLRNFRFSVSDNGPMIPQASISSIFQPGVTSKGEGHGMGLYIVRETLREHGGDIAVESCPGSTTFSGYIPREITAGQTHEEGTK